VAPSHPSEELHLIDSFITHPRPRSDMKHSHIRLSLFISILMAMSPMANAGVSNWSGPSVVTSDGTPNVVEGFTVPSNGTVLDGWIHVSNDPVSNSVSNTVVWEGNDFDNGVFLGTILNDDNQLKMKDDASISIFEDFEVGDIDVSLNTDYLFTPGWRRVYTYVTGNNLTECGFAPGAVLSHGLDVDFDTFLDSDEIVESTNFCETTANTDKVMSLTIQNPGEGYVPGNLSASGGSGSNFSGTYVTGHGLESITVTNGGSNYLTSDNILIRCPNCVGSGATAEITSVNSSTGAITSMSVVHPGSGYLLTEDPTVLVTSGSGSGASFTTNLFLTGNITSTTILDQGHNFTSTPDILISDANGSEGNITAILGANYTYEVEIDPLSSGSACEHGGFQVESGLDLNDNRDLDSSEITQTNLLCHQLKLWEATTFTSFTGNLTADGLSLDHGVIPTSAAEGIVSAGTVPGEPVPAGTDGSLLIPSTQVPDSQNFNNYYLNFQHWFHINSSSSGGGDGVWMEYRLQSASSWGDWIYMEPSSGYPSTMAPNAPVPNGATSPVPVFASTSHSGWVESNFTLDVLDGIDTADNIQFRFRIWTDPNSTIERPGWFLDDILINNDGVSSSGSLVGDLSVSIGFEDSTVGNPSVSDAPGWSRTSSMNSGSCGSGSFSYEDRCKFTLNQIGANSGPPATTSFPYLYGLGFSGNYYHTVDDASIISPEFDIPQNSNPFLTFDHWACIEPSWDAATVFVMVNGGNWQHFDPGNWYSHTPLSSAVHNYGGYASFGRDHCSGSGWTTSSPMTTMLASLSSYQGDLIRFKFSFGSDYSVSHGGWFIDNVGVRVENYGEVGHWLTPSIDIAENSQLNIGFVDIDAIIYNQTWVRASLVEPSTGIEIPGFSNISFPFSLAGVDSQMFPEVKIKIHLGTFDPEVSPLVNGVHVGGNRILNADTGYNGWEISSGIEVIDGQLNATSVSGTISSDYIFSSRPIKKVIVGGEISSVVSVTIKDKSGNSLATLNKGQNIEFLSPQTGFSAVVNLPPNGWIENLQISAIFANPASNSRIDILDDGTNDWAFPFDGGYGHLGWQSFIGDPGGQFSRSKSITLDGSNPEQSFFMIPSTASVTSGMFAIAPDSDGFDSTLSVSIAGSTMTLGSGYSPQIKHLSPAQVSAISLITPTHTDSVNGRDWLEVPIQIDSSSAQNVSISTIGIWYNFFENKSGFGQDIANFQANMVPTNPPTTELDIPVSVTSDYGSVAIDGSIVFDYIITNHDFSTPNTLFPNGDTFEIVTRHRHLYDNSELSEITLTGLASDGNSISFNVRNSADGLWGSGSPEVTFSQNGGATLAPLDIGLSYLEVLPNPDGHTDIVVHWKFRVTWDWDDVDEILWNARANDVNGETIWTAESRSGTSGSKAVENDLQFESFVVEDDQSRVLSNSQQTLFYPYPAISGSELSISGTIRFQDSTDSRPMASDFSVSVDVAGSLIPLQSGDQGSFSGTIMVPASAETLSLFPVLTSIGPQGGSNGAHDASGDSDVVEVLVDGNPPIAGPLEMMTLIGLQPANGMVSDPTILFAPYITISEGEARGDALTLRYWREGIDDTDGDGLADEPEYLSQVKPLSTGLKGEQQVQFTGIDVSGMANDPIHLFVEGTDWAGLSFQDGGTGGGAGAENSWATVIIAVDTPTEFAGAGLGTGQSAAATFGLDVVKSDSGISYLLPGKDHTFTLRLIEPNGFHTIDNISVMLCGHGTDVGRFTYAPFSGSLWSPEGSMVTPVSVEVSNLDDSLIESRFVFRISWDMPFSEDDNDCKPKVMVTDNLDSIESPSLTELGWFLDNGLTAQPESVSDLTAPFAGVSGTSIYLGQGDEFSVSGTVVHSGSNSVIDDITPDLAVQASLVYGSEELQHHSPVNPNGTFEILVKLPNRAPSDPKMTITTTIVNSPGLALSIPNSESSVTVDTRRPTAVFDVVNYPDSSLQFVETHSLGEIPVTIKILDQLGMNDGPLQVSWNILRDGEIITESSSIDELPHVSSFEDSHLYQGTIDFRPPPGIEVLEGDKLSFWISSTDRAGNTVAGLGGPENPRQPAFRLVDFIPTYTREVISPTNNPYVGELLQITTYWENPGKMDGTITVGLYEQNEEGVWQKSKTTSLFGDTEIYLPPESSSIKVDFEYEAWREGQPLLILVIDDDFENQNFMNVEISGIDVVMFDDSDRSDGSTVWLIGAALLAIILAGVGYYIIKSKGEDYYYDDEDYEKEEEDHYF